MRRTILLIYGDYASLTTRAKLALNKAFTTIPPDIVIKLCHYSKLPPQNWILPSLHFKVWGRTVFVIEAENISIDNILKALKALEQ